MPLRYVCLHGRPESLPVIAAAFMAQHVGTVSATVMVAGWIGLLVVALLAVSRLGGVPAPGSGPASL